MTARIAITDELPWLTSTRNTLHAAMQGDRVGAAVLIQIAPGSGGDWLARWCAAAVFCTAPTAGAPCGRCVECRRVENNEHPDLALVSPLEDSKEIKVDQVRALAQDLALTSHGGRRKVVILTPAERLNRNAATALLKTLEEPPGDALLMLVTGEPSRLPITVQSRCTRITAPAPDRAELARWLAVRGGSVADWTAALSLYGGRPLDVLDLDPVALAGLHRDTHRVLDEGLRGSLDPVETAEAWARDDVALRIAAIESWVQSRAEDWARGRARLDARALFETAEDLREARGWLDTPINKPLALERILWRVAAIGGARRR